MCAAKSSEGTLGSANNSNNIENSKNGDGIGQELKWHQFHLWIGSDDYSFLEQLAKQEEEPIARIVRRLIRQFRRQSELIQR
jgi:hypothetical protein